MAHTVSGTITSVSFSSSGKQKQSPLMQANVWTTKPRWICRLITACPSSQHEKGRKNSHKILNCKPYKPNYLGNVHFVMKIPLFLLLNVLLKGPKQVTGVFSHSNKETISLYLEVWFFFSFIELAEETAISIWHTSMSIGWLWMAAAPLARYSHSARCFL